MSGPGGPPLRILCLDGGGVRGVVAALVLAELELATRRPVVDLFDLVAGTSTGAILALGLVRPDAGGQRPRWTARELAEVYADEHAHVFSRSAWRAVRTVNGFLAPKYTPERLTRQLHERLGDSRMGEAVREVMITTYDTRHRVPFLLLGGPGAGPDGAALMRTAAQASSAAPTYFPPVRYVEPGGRERWLADGGVMANNPAVWALTRARAVHPGRPVLMLSVGCGALSTDLATPRMRAAGALLWARPLFDMMLDGQEDLADHEVRRLLGPDDYLRLQADLPDTAERIDDDSPANLRALRGCAERLLAERSGALLPFAARLAAVAA